MNRARRAGRTMLPILAILTVVTAACSAATPTATAPASATSSPSQAAAATQSAAASQVAGGTMTSAFDLEVGDCFNVPEAATITEVAVFDCAEPHDYELYAAIQHPGATGDPYPGSAEMEAYAEAECLADFEGFVGTAYQSSDLYIYYLQPSEDTWGAGDREVLCSVYDPNGQLTGSMAGSGR